MPINNHCQIKELRPLLNPDGNLADIGWVEEHHAK